MQVHFSAVAAALEFGAHRPELDRTKRQEG